MIIVMRLRSTEDQIKNVEERLKELGFRSHLIKGIERIVIGVVGNAKLTSTSVLERMPGVEKIVPVMAPYKLVSREIKQDNTIVQIGEASVGDSCLAVMAGPCAVESQNQLLDAAKAVKKSGAVILRGGAYKPRTSPYSFQGLEKEGLEILAEARHQTGLKVVTEVIDPHDVSYVSNYVDILQIGARNMQNFSLLKEVGVTKKPVLLKRGISATIEEWLMAAEYILAEGNYNVILCERGIRTYEKYTRNTLDISAVPLVKQLSHLPVIVDPSHSSGNWRLVSPLAKAAVAAGADGLIIEVHPDPDQALCDGQQSLTPKKFDYLMRELEPVAVAVGRHIC